MPKFQVKVDERTTRILADIVGHVQIDRDNFQYGVGTLIGEIAEIVIEHPDMLQRILSTLPEKGRQKAASAARASPEKKGGAGERAA